MQWNKCTVYSWTVRFVAKIFHAYISLVVLYYFCLVKCTREQRLSRGRRLKRLKVLFVCTACIDTWEHPTRWLELKRCKMLFELATIVDSARCTTRECELKWRERSESLRQVLRLNDHQPKSMVSNNVLDHLRLFFLQNVWWARKLDFEKTCLTDKHEAAPICLRAFEREGFHKCATSHAR